ncbi:sterol desaturase family protein [Marinomonas epiphytica]
MDFSLRVGVFFAALTTLLLWQYLALRSPLPKWRKRWCHNLFLLALGAVCVRLIQPALLSLVAVSSPVGLIWENIGIPSIVLILISIFALDCLIYWQHRLFHTLPWLWRLHRVHHTDVELDISSAVRFHPVEIALSLLIKSIAIWCLGVPFEAVVLFDMLLNASAMFNHTNARLPTPLERQVKKLVVTPDMHRIHHSRINQEANSNYGFFLSIWDRLFASYTERAQGGDQAINIGLPSTKNYEIRSLKELLWFPFKRFNNE